MPKNNSPETAEALSGPRSTVKNFVGTNDRNDYYSFSIKEPSDVSLLLSGVQQNASVSLDLLADLNDDTAVTDNEYLRSSSAHSSSDGRINLTLAAGDYFIRVYTRNESSESEYILNLETSPTNLTTPSDPGNAFTEALDIGTLSDRQTFRDHVGTFDRDDFYLIIIEEPSDFSLLLSDKDDYVGIQLLADLNDDTQVDTDEIVGSVSRSKGDQRIDFPIGAGTYYLRIFTDDERYNTSYLLNLEAPAIPRTTPFDPGNTLNTALDIGSVSSRQTFRDFVGLFDENDYYRFNLTQDADFSLLLSDVGNSASADVQLIDDSGEVVAGSIKASASSNDRAIDTFLEKGTSSSASSRTMVSTPRIS